MTSFSAIDITVDDDIAEVVIQDMKTIPRKFKALYRKRIDTLAQTTIRKLRVVPPKPRYPLRWKTEKQRRAFFASDGFGKGIPTKRTGALQKGWQYELISDFREGLFTIYNSATSRNYFTGAVTFYEQFVSGENMQPFHRDTGYIPSQNILADTLVDAQEILIDTWFFVNDAK